MKPPSILRIRIGFLLAPPGGLRSSLRQLQKDKSHRNRIPVRNRIDHQSAAPPTSPIIIVGPLEAAPFRSLE
jgi:hypothetical protein